MKKLLSILFALISFSVFAQPGSLSQSVYRSRVNDSTVVNGAHDSGYGDIFWNNQRATPAWVFWDGNCSCYKTMGSGGGSATTRNRLPPNEKTASFELAPADTSSMIVLNDPDDPLIIDLGDFTGMPSGMQFSFLRYQTDTVYFDANGETLVNPSGSLGIPPNGFAYLYYDGDANQFTLINGPSEGSGGGGSPGIIPWVQATGTNTYSATGVPASDVIFIQFENTNSGASTLNTGGGAVDIHYWDGDSYAVTPSGLIKPEIVYRLDAVGGVYQLQSIGLVEGQAVENVLGTSNRIDVGGSAINPQVDISSTFEALLGKVATPLSQFAATTSAQLRGTISDELGTGSLLFDGATPTSLVGTNITGTAAGLTAGTVTTNANLTGDVTSSGNATTLSTTGVSASTYKSVTVDTKGRVTAGTNPTTLSGYGITDAWALGGNTLAGNAIFGDLSATGFNVDFYTQNVLKMRLHGTGTTFLSLINASSQNIHRFISDGSHLFGTGSSSLVSSASSAGAVSATGTYMRMSGAGVWLVGTGANTATPTASAVTYVSGNITAAGTNEFGAGLTNRSTITNAGQSGINYYFNQNTGTINCTGGTTTTYAFYYAPTRTSVTGVTERGVVLPDAVPNGFGVSAPTRILEVGGSVAVKAGNSSGVIARVGGTIETNTTQTGNVGTGEDVLFTYSVPAATLNTNEDALEGRVSGTFATSVNTKRIRINFGSSVIFDTGALSITTAADWVLTFEIIRTGATTQKCNTMLTTGSATLTAFADIAAGAETLSGAVTLTVTGEGTSNNDIVGETLKLKWIPAE